MTSSFNLPRLEPAKYRWTISATDKSARRLAIGTEQWVGIKHENEKGQYDNYLSTTLRLSSSGPSLEDLHRYVASALIHLRYQHPEVAATAVWEADQPTPPTIVYTPPSIEEAQAWAADTVLLCTSSLDGHALRTKQERLRASNPHHGNSVSVLLSADVESPHAPITENMRVVMLCRFNHIFWDAMSSRQFVGDLLRQVGVSWTKKEDPAEAAKLYSWGDEIKNLAEPLLDSLKIDVESLGQDYDAATNSYLAELMKSASSWGLSINNTVGTPRTDFVTFTAAESIAMIESVKTRVGPQYTISHLGHAAMVLALLKIRPIPSDMSDTAHLCSPLPVNGRRYLKTPKMTRYGCCQAGAVVQFPDLASWTVDDNDSDAVKNMLDRGCNHVKEGYDSWLKNDFQVAVNMSKDNFLAAYLSSATSTPKSSSIPVFVSDGIVDHYVPSSVKSPADEELFSVDDCIFFLDTYGSDILIRMDSFKGATALSISYNDGYLSSEIARQMLKYVATYILAIV